MQIEPRHIKNILCVRNDRFGEFLLNIPSLRALKETFVNAKIICIVSPSVRELAQNIPFIYEIIEWSQKEHSLSEKFRLINLLKTKQIDMAIMLNPSREFNVVTYLSGIPVRVGYGRKWGFLLTHKIKDEKYLGRKHEIEYNLELVGLVGAKTEDKTLFLSTDDKAINGLIQDFGIEGSRIIAIHPWTSDPVKQWPFSNFSELAKKIVKQGNVRVVIIGGKEELAKSAEFFGGVDANLINLTGRTTLMQLAALLKKCRLLISGDSGPLHLAYTVGAQVLAIFRSDIPAKSSRRWGPYEHRHIVIEKDNLDDITVDEVLDKVKEVTR